MAKANVILLNSILWNLRELTKLTEKVKGRCGDVDCTSWRYPLTSCSELEIFKLLQNSRNLDNYTFILELTYDRLLYLFNLIIKYLESTESLKSFRPSRNVCRPKMLSLAAVLQMIWERIQARTEADRPAILPEKSEEGEPEKVLNVTELAASKSSIYTQSEVSTISLCSSCEMVQQFVTQLVLEMEKVEESQDYCSAITSERKFMRESLAEMTTWSAMSRWLSAILKDFTSLIEKIDQAHTHSRKLRTRMESGEKKMKFRTDQQEEEIRRLENRIKDQDTKLSDLKLKLDKLSGERSTLTEQIKHKNLELNQRNSEFEGKIADLKKNYENKLKEKKQKTLERKKEKEEELKQELQAERAKSKELAEQNGRFEKAILQLSQSLEQTNLKTAEEKENWLSKHNSLEKEIECLKLENSKLQTSLEEKEKKINDYTTKLLEAFPELHDTSEYKLKVFYSTESSNHQKSSSSSALWQLSIVTSLNFASKSFTASGVPEIDMEFQIEANLHRMDLLKSENEKLQKTLDKIKALKG